MNFYVDSGGVVLHVEPERIFQGSANVNTIRFVGAFASDLPVLVAFKLPNGVWTTPQSMGFSAQLSGVETKDGVQFNTWEYQIPQVITENYGTVNIQFYIYGDAGGTGGQIASAMSSFVVEKGVPITLPDPTDDYQTLLTQILSALSQLQGYYDQLSPDVDQLKTDVARKVNKTTLASQVYGTDSQGNQTVIPYGTTGLGNSIVQYTASSEVRIPMSPTQPYYAANRDYVDKGLSEKFDKAGGLINGDVEIGGELRALSNAVITGDLTVQGTTITEDAETIMSKANVIVTNSEGVPLTQLSGLGIRTNATQVYGIMYDPLDDTVKLGEGTLDENNEFAFNEGEGTAVAARADSAMWTNGHLAQWNAVEYRFVDSGIAVDNVVTTNTAQQITGAKTFAQAVRVEIGNVYASYNTDGILWRDSNGNDHTNIFPASNGTLALKSDIPADYVTQEEFEKAQRSISDIYTILGQTVILWQSLTQEYTMRETAAGLEIIDGALTEVEEIRGKTVAATNLIPYPYIETTKTVNGVTFTDNGDGTITVNGTATADSDFSIQSWKSVYLPAGDYFFSGTPSNGSTTTYYINYAAKNGDTTIFDFQEVGNGRAITASQNITNIYGAIRIKAGAVLSNVIFRPMMNAGTEAESYSKWFAGLKNAFFKEIVSTGKNLFSGIGSELHNCTYENGVVKQINSNNSSSMIWKAQTYHDLNLISQVEVDFANTGRIPALTFEKTSYINCLTFGLNGNTRDTKLSIYISELPNGKYTITWNVLNTTQGSISWNDIMLNRGSSALPYEPYISDTLSAENPIKLTEYDIAYPETGETKIQSNTNVFNGNETWDNYTNDTLFIYTSKLKNIVATRNNFMVICNIFPTSTTNGIALTGDRGGSYDYIGVRLNKTQYPEFDTVNKWKSWLAAQSAAGNPLTVTYKTAKATTEATPFNKSRYQAWDGGSERIEQGANDNSEYGAENTVVQNYATKRGGTTE